MVELASPEDEISHVAANSLSIVIPIALRVSMDDSYDQTSSLQSDCTMDSSVDSPPSYDADTLLQSPLLRRIHNIQPREDEGREALPPYSSEISLENVFSRKLELEEAVHRASDRNWYQVYASLQGTALTFYEYKSGYFSGWSSTYGRSDAATPERKARFLKSYNLQHADVGIAADYFKKRYVIRVRAETDQFLLSCFQIETFVSWLQALAVAIDVAPPLDTRGPPRDFSMPRTRRKQSISSTCTTDLEQNAVLVREQYEIIRRQYPTLIEGPVPGYPTAIVQGRAYSTPLPFRPFPNRFTGAPAFSSSINIRAPVDTPEIHPSVSPEGKWRPDHHWSATYDMMYARRCMAILTKRSPRKSNMVIMKGKQWVVDWATGKLTSCEPPDYREIVERPLSGVGSRGLWGVRLLGVSN